MAGVGQVYGKMFGKQILKMTMLLAILMIRYVVFLQSIFYPYSSRLTNKNTFVSMGIKMPTQGPDKGRGNAPGGHFSGGLHFW